MSEALKQWVTTELTRRGWSHREFARQTGLSHSFVSKVIAGKTPPNSDFCVKVAIAFDVAPEYLLRLAGILPSEPLPTDKPGPVTAEIMAAVEQLPAEKRKQVLEYIRFIAQNRD